MNHEVPFDSVESAHGFVNLLAQVVLETRHDIEADVQRETNSNLPRRLEALQLTVYKMQTLEFHLKKSRCILNDLRSLRRLLFGERTNGNLAVPGTSIGIAKAEATPSTPSNPLSEVSRLEDDEALLGLTG